MKNRLKKLIVGLSLLTMTLSIIGPAQAVVVTGDHFTLTSAGDVITMNSGATLVFTVKSYNSSNVARAFTGDDKACVSIMDPTTMMPSITADITAKGDGLTITDYSTGTTAPYPLISGSELGGSNNNVACFNITAGDSITNTLTITATSSFNIFVYAYQGQGTINDGTDLYPGVDFLNITVAAASSGADHLAASVSGTPEAGTAFSVSVNQVNTGGGIVTSALTNVSIATAVGITANTQTGTFKSSAAHALAVNNIIKFSTGATDATKAYIVSAASTADTFKVIGTAQNLVSAGTGKLTVQALSDSTTKAMSATPGAIVANTSSAIAMGEDPTALTAGNIVTVAGCTASYYQVVSATTDPANSINVIGPTACASPTGNGNVTLQSLSAGAESVYTLSKNGVYIASIGGVSTGNTTTYHATSQSLTSGQLALTVMDTVGGEAFLIVPNDVGAELSGTNVNSTVTPSASTNLTIQGYGPMNGQTGLSTMPMVDVFFNKNPSGGTVTFPLTNSLTSAISIATGGAAVVGQWEAHPELNGSNTFYRTVFVPTSGMLTSSTAYTVSILKSLAAGGTSLPVGVTALTSTDTAYTSTFTTSAGGGGSYTPPPSGMGSAPGGMGGGYTGTYGGSVPPMAMLSYPMPGMWNVPTNISKITIDFDRPMDATTFTNTNIYLKKITVVGGVDTETDPGVTTSVSPTTGTSKTAYLTITGSLSTDSKYRVIVSRNVKDTVGTQLAGMPLDANGNPQQGFIGFGGYDNMGSLKENFNTGTGTSTITAASMGCNLDQYSLGGVLTGVPTTIRIRNTFNNPLDPSTVNSTNVTLKMGSATIAGTVTYDGMGNAIEFIPSSTLLASTQYTFTISTSVTSVTGTALSSAITKSFTTGVADVVAPQLAFVEVDNYGFKVKFNEAMDATSVVNKSYYTLKTCTNQNVNADGAACADATAPTTFSLMSGVTAINESFENMVIFNGLTLTSNDGFYLEISSSVTDAASNAINSSNDTWTGRIMGANNFAGGQGMFVDIGMEDFNMATMGMTPIEARPMNSMGGATTKYFIRFPVSTVIPSGGWVELTFPTGFTITGAKQDAQSPMKTDFNGPNTGTITFATNLTGVTPTPTDGAGTNQPGDGVGYLAAANKVYVKLSAATQATDFMQIDLDGITNTIEGKDPSSGGYQVLIKTFNTSGVLLEALTSMPFFITTAGTNSIGGQISSGATKLNTVKVFLGSPMTGPMEATTANNANGGGQDGEYKFSNLPAGQYFLWTEPIITVGATDYSGKNCPENITVDGVETKNFSLTASNGTNGATQPVTITYTQAGLSTIASLGYNDSIDIFAGGPTGFMSKTVARSSLTGTSYTTNMFPSAGNWMIGIGPAIPRGPMSMPPEIDWIPSQPAQVNILSTDIGGAAKSAVTFALSAADKTISGKIIDASSTAISNAEVYAYNPKGGIGAHTKAAADGTFTLNVIEGTYKVGAFLPGMPNSSEISALVSGSSVYIDGSATASTGSSGANPFYLKISKSNITIQGRVSDGTSAIANAPVWAHRTDSPAPPVHAMSDTTGNYTLYVSAGTWKVEADAPGYGYLGSTTATITTSSLTGQDFTVASGQNTITGTVDIAGTSNDAGTIVTIYGASGVNETTTATDGTFSMSLPSGTYTVVPHVPGMGELPSQTLVVDGTEAIAEIEVATPRTSTITLDTALTADTLLTFFDTNGKGNELTVPAGSTTASVTLPEGTYYVETDLPGMALDNVTMAGGEFNNVNGTPGTDNKINLDGTGDDITIDIPVIYTISGRVTSSSTGINDVTIKVINTTTQDTFAVTTANNAAGGGLDGEYQIKLPAGTFSLAPNKPGYDVTPIDLTVSANSTGNNFALTANSRTITGTVTTGGVAISGATVYAESSGGGYESTTTGTDGTYTLSVKPGMWTVNSVEEGYSAGTALQVNTTSANQSSKNFSETALSGANVLQEPTTEACTPSSGCILMDQGTNTEITIPPNALGSESDTGQVTTKETNEVPTTPSATPIGNGQVIEATNSEGQPINTLDDDITFKMKLTVAELATAGVDTPTEANGVAVGYFDETADEWVPENTTPEYYNSSNVIIPESTVDDSATLVAAGVSYIKYKVITNHFTTYAPIISVGATPPATPTGLAATAGDASATLTWTKNSEADMSSYNIWEANVTEGILTTLTQAICGTSTCSKTISSLTNGTAYAFQVAAVDTDGNVSAYATAVNVTPVAATTPGGGTMVIGGGSGSKKTTTTTTEETTTTVESLDVSTISATVSQTAIEITAGAISSAMTLMAENEVAAVTFAENTVATTAAGEAYSGGISPPAAVTSTVSAPSGKEVIGSVYEVGPADVKLTFDKPVTVRLPLPSDTDLTADLAVYYINENNKWVLAGDGGEVKKLEDNSLVIEVAVDHLTKFAVMEATEEEVAGLTSFEDISGHWAKTFIEDLFVKGIISGYDAKHYGPDKSITRAEFTKIAISAFGIPTLDPAEIEFMPFEDVATDSWYAPYVQAAFVWHIVSGYEDGTFKPDAFINRAEAVKILLEAADLNSETEYDAGFPDVDPDAWYVFYINYAAEKGIINGYQDGTFGPENNLTRGEVAKIVSLMLQMDLGNGVVGMVLNMVM